MSVYCTPSNKARSLLTLMAADANSERWRDGHREVCCIEAQFSPLPVHLHNRHQIKYVQWMRNETFQGCPWRPNNETKVLMADEAKIPCSMQLESWKPSIWQNPDQERTNHDAWIYLKTALPYIKWKYTKFNILIIFLFGQINVGRDDHLLFNNRKLWRSMRTIIVGFS